MQNYYPQYIGTNCPWNLHESPLSVTVDAGVQGLPTLLKLMTVMTLTGKKQEWQSMKQLPVPVDLDREFQFHSVFVCPVSRDQVSEENPPMLLTCGHVLCKQYITKLSKNNSTRRFKCPYCPTEVEAGGRYLCERRDLIQGWRRPCIFVINVVVFEQIHYAFTL